MTSESFQQRTNAVQLRGFLIADRVHDGSAMRETGYQPLRLQLTKSFTNRCPADAHHFAKLSLYKPLPGLEAPAGYTLAKLLFHLDAERSVLFCDLEFSVVHMSGPVCDRCPAITGTYMASKREFDKLIV